MIWEAVVTLLWLSTLYLAWWLGLRQGRKDGVSKHYEKRRAIEAKRRQYEETGLLPPSVRRAVIKPTSRRRSQVDLED